MNTVFRRLCLEGIGTEVHHTPIITVDEEEKMWESAVLNITTPKIQRAAFYYVGKCFCVHGGQEQRNLGPSNFRFLCKPGNDLYFVVYEEHVS